MNKKPIHLAWFSGHGLGPGSTAWNDDRMPEQLRWDRPDLYIQQAQVMERAGFDFLLFADTFGIPDDYQGSMATYLKYAVAMPKMDPAVIAPMITAKTSSLGVVATLSTLYYPPYLLARLAATLDHVTEGRFGWNMVTSASERAAQNFGLDQLPPHDHRYEVADEYLDVVKQLWSSWDPDALIMDREQGLFADPSRVHSIDHVGQYFKVRGPLNVSRSPQGRPLLVQAGSSPRGIEFAARHADVVITNRNSVPEMRSFRQRVRAAAVDAGRGADDVKVFFIVSPRVLDSSDARDVGHMRSGASSLELGLAQLSTNLGQDMSRLPLDQPLDALMSTNGSLSTLEQFAELDGHVPTLREIALHVGTWVSMPVEGTAEEVADQLEEIFDEVDGDGFAIRGHWIPEYVNDICGRVAGILRHRGRLQPPDPSLTLRERVAGGRIPVLQ